MLRKLPGALADGAARVVGLVVITSLGLWTCGDQAVAAPCSGSVIFAGAGTTTEGTNTFPGLPVGTVGMRRN